jgi:hypothetical protein
MPSLQRGEEQGVLGQVDQATRQTDSTGGSGSQGCRLGQLGCRVFSGGTEGGRASIVARILWWYDISVVTYMQGCTIRVLNPSSLRLALYSLVIHIIHQLDLTIRLAHDCPLFPQQVDKRCDRILLERFRQGSYWRFEWRQTWGRGL